MPLLERSSHEYSNCPAEPFKRRRLRHGDHRSQRLCIRELNCLHGARPIVTRRPPAGSSPGLQTARPLGSTPAMPQRLLLIMIKTPRWTEIHLVLLAGVWGTPSTDSLIQSRAGATSLTPPEWRIRLAAGHHCFARPDRQGVSRRLNGTNSAVANFKLEVG